MSQFNFSWQPKEVSPVSTRYRTIKTALPVPEALPILKDLESNESRSMHGQMPVVWHGAKDFQVFDKWGNTWIDFTSTIFVANTGHANPRIKKALMDVIEQDLLHTYNYPTEIRAKFLKALVNSTPHHFEKMYLMSSGTEATECLMKLIRLHGQKIGKRKPGVVSFTGAYHGRTMGAALIGGTSESQHWIGHKDPNIYQLHFPYEWDLNGKDPVAVFHEQIAELEAKGVDWNQDICGFVLESYIGWCAGFFPEAYVQALANFAKSKNILLTFDEIQSGFGRTGKFFAYEHYGVEPDLIACGKGISSSLPLSAVMGPKAIMDLPETGSMSSTHSANPLSCAAGLANLETIIDEKLVEMSQKKGEILHERLEAMRERSKGWIKLISGKGMLAAILFENPETKAPECAIPSKICEKAMQSGLLLVHTGRESIKIGPPLTIPVDALNEGLDVLEACINEYIG